ncbi:hypothetical protein D4Q52_14685 [Rhodopseudomonas palustris]|uniref:Uncharacterized protein n=1 Tax=Rhodopseudomonas palustris TaxID=1076 RepID=A0A418V465_RHOPL|nr:hypothetical protein D4Q52_14685 [Rhodopseudomonas palustris]
MQIRSKSDRGRRRIRRVFTRERSVIPLAALSSENFDALVADTELIVQLYVPAALAAESHEVNPLATNS